MDRSKKKKLETAGWRVGDAGDFLELTDAERKIVDMKLALSARLKKAREQKKLTQSGLAKLMGSSQSRVAKMEAGDPSVSLELLVHGLLAAGASQAEIAKTLAAPTRRKSAA